MDPEGEDTTAGLVEQMEKAGLDDGTSSKAELMRQKLAANEEARLAEVAKRREERSAQAAPSESVSAFLGHFNARCTDINTRLTTLTNSGGEEGGTKSAQKALDAITAELQDLEKSVAEASYYLPAYDARASLSAVAALRQKTDQLRVKLAPRQKFTFASRDAYKQQQEMQRDDSSRDASTAEPSNRSADSLLPEQHKTVVPGLRGRRGETLVIPAADLGDGDAEYMLEDLKDMTVWLCGPMRALFIHRIQNCQIYSGPVKGSMLIEDVRNCSVMVAAHQIRIHAAIETDFYLQVRSNPIVEHCSGVRVAPYEMYYTGLQRHRREAGLSDSNDLWQQVHDFGWLRATASPNWSVLPAGKRKSFTAMQV
eukprot:CAMPEP_0118942182 /NCGR_PEP_ID=MMETSP1169-20130426/35601_1 /TAXON_ID=36882 /ORGANISM="Pyramimonas obovata, Strain CCMP722" /LENGTH=367 /DNA_ID=CAMNT_0006887155 /DNA_START=61 /DNA_END=1160 /DNA_ORIENTATION=-